MILLEVTGEPRPQGSKTAFVRGGRAVLVDGTSAKGRAGHQAWRQAVASAARDYLADHPMSPLDGPVNVSIGFRMPRPAAAKHRTRHVTKPDLDKLIRSVLDSLVSGGILADDSKVYSLSASKMYVEDGATIGATIVVIDDTDDEVRDREWSKEASRRARKRASI